MHVEFHEVSRGLFGSYGRTHGGFVQDTKFVFTRSKLSGLLWDSILVSLAQTTAYLLDLDLEFWE